MNVLIIGGAGFVGVNLVRRCLQDGHLSITVLDSLEPALRSSIDNLRDVFDRISFVHGSMNDPALMGRLVQGQDIIFNCAAQTSHPLSIEMPLFDAEINCLGNLRLLEAIRQHNRNAIVVYTSSSTVIGRAVGDLIDEEHGERPLDIYSANKGVAEKYYRIYHQVHDLKTVVLRFANLYGPYGKGFPEFGFVNYFIHQAMQWKEITIYGSGEQTRNVLHVDDAIESLLVAARTPGLQGKVYFATHEEHLSVFQIAETIVRIVGKGRISHVDWPDQRRRIEIDKVRISSAQLRSITGWTPRFGFEEGIKRTVHMMRENG